MAKLDLAKINLLKNLTPLELKSVKHFLIDKKYQEGDFIFKKGDTRDKIIIINSGQAVLQTEDGEAVAMFKEGDVLGEMALIEKNNPHQHSLKVSSQELKTLELSLYNWSSLIKRHHLLTNKIHQNIVTILESRLNHANNKLVTLFTTGKIIGAYDNLPAIADQIIKSVLKVIPSKKALFLGYSSSTNKIYVYKNIAYAGIKENSYFNAYKDPILKVLIKMPETTFFSKNNKIKAFKDSLYYSQSCIIVPIILKNKILGFIILGDKINRKEYSLNNKILLEAIGHQVAPAIEEIRRKEIEFAKKEIEASYIDPFYRY